MKRLTQLLITLIVIFVATVTKASQMPLLLQNSIEAETMAVAERLYANGRYAESAQTYQQLADQGFQNSDLYYNLGNAYFKAGKVGRAVLNLERAARLAPRDEVIRDDLAFVQQQINVDSPTNGLAQVAEVSRDQLTLNETAVLTLILWWLLLAFIWATRRLPRWQGIASAGWRLTAVLLVMSLVLLGSRLYVERTQPLAIVVASDVGVSQVPGSERSGALLLLEGTAVRVLEQRARWSEIVAADGAGWVPNEAIKLVDGVEIGE